MMLLKKITNGEYKDAIDICKIIAEIRTFMSPDVRHKMAKPYDEMYKEILRKKLNS